MGSEREIVLRPFIEQEDYMNERITTGIEQNRKGRINLVVVDSEGNPVPGARISVNQKKHEFKIGAVPFALAEFDSEEKTQEYKRLFADCFNLATLPFYWVAVEPEKGKTRYAKGSSYMYRRPPVDLCLEFCEEYGIEPKGHCLEYDHFSPDWVKSMDELSEIRSAIYKHFAEIAELYADRVPTWEVTNENLNRPSKEKSTLHFYQDDTVEWDFRTAEKMFPLNKLVLNEATDNVWGKFIGNRSAYYMMIERALNKGCRIDSIGMQFHIHHGLEKEIKDANILYSPENIYNVMDRYSDFSLPLQITEISIPSYGYDEGDEDMQAEIMKNLYSMWFSHSNMEAIICWDLPDGYDWTPYKCGLVKQDLTPKKAYYTIRDLFGKTWRTNLDTVTNDGGCTTFKAFYGDYDVTIHANGKEVTKRMRFLKNGKREFTVTI